MSSLGVYEEHSDENGITGQTHIPGFSFVENRRSSWMKHKFAGVLSKHYQMIQPLWRAEDILWHQPQMFLCDSTRKEQGTALALSFIKFMQVKFTADYIQAFNTYRRNKEHDVPMTGTASLMRLGNTSATVHSVLRNAVTGVHYGSFEILYVLVDTETRRPIPFPKTLRQKYSIDERLAKNTDDKLGVTTQTSDSLVKTADTDDNPKKASKRNNKPIKVVTTGDIPEDSVIVWNKVTIQPHMIDSNEHTNIDFYQELALEVLGKALKQGIFPEYAHINSSEDINVREILLHFHGESLLGDILHVGVWHEDHQKDIFQCVIKKHGQVLVTLQIHLLEKISSKVMANI